MSLVIEVSLTAKVINNIKSEEGKICVPSSLLSPPHPIRQEKIQPSFVLFNVSIVIEMMLC